MLYTLDDIIDVLQGTGDPGNQHIIRYLVIDSRKIYFPEISLFFALRGGAFDGHKFIPDAYKKGIRCFVVSEQVDKDAFEKATFITVPDTLAALQKLAVAHRHRFHFPVIGITGSMGKTMVKEWLFQLLNNEYNVVRSPKSFNSQVGVPLALWQMDESHNLGLFEAGISEVGEMARLQSMIHPTIGIVTFLGHEHKEGFKNIAHKMEEKLSLFSGADTLVYGSDDESLDSAVKAFKQHKNKTLQLFTWGHLPGADFHVLGVAYTSAGAEVSYLHNQVNDVFVIPFRDQASVQNVIICLAVAVFLRMPVGRIKEKLGWLRPLQLRMELKEGVNECSLIIDRYHPDVNSLNIALDFLNQQQQYSRRTVILNDLAGAAQTGVEDCKNIADLLLKKNIYRFIGVGPVLKKYAYLFDAIEKTHFFLSGKELLQQLAGLHLYQETILIKGSKSFEFDLIGQALEKKLHQTFLEINLNAIRHNLNVYRQLAGQSVKLMGMVKAFSYGSGSVEIAGLLQHAGVDYLGVAYADEGVVLRKAGIRMPVMVMNTEEAGFENILTHCLEPELYSIRILKTFVAFLQAKCIEGYFVHLKIETGMHRLGIEQEEIQELCTFLKSTSAITVRSVFSHLAASGESRHDEFTKQQGKLLSDAARQVETALGYPVLKHINNTAGIHQHPELQWDMVRLGIGMYGIDSHQAVQGKLQHVTTLKTTISQIKKLKKGDSVGYSRSAIAETDIIIATVRIGYADGYPRLLSNGVGYMLVNGARAPVIGRVCMDMTMLDISNIAAEEEDEVIVFGELLPVSQLAEWANTIEYEILTNISQRVRRVYYEE